MCLYPKIITNKRYTKTKKNGGVIPPLPRIIIDGKEREDRRVLTVPVGCGNCMECRKQKSREWQVRLHEDIKTNNNGVFITLTFSDEGIEELGRKLWKLDGYDKDNEIAKMGMRRFLERWRKKYKKSVRHWMVTDLGHNGTKNIHLHGIIWTDIEHEEIRRIWRYGFVWIGSENNGYVNGKTVNYTVKYIYKQDDENEYYKPIILTSSGIGRNYTKTISAEKNMYDKKGTIETYRNEQGLEMGLPIYYRNKIYTDEEKEKLWIEKLEKEVRYVNGQEIDISKDEEEYYKVLKEARRKNSRLGYGSSKINWSRRKYERERRNINYEKRIKRAAERGAKKGKQIE